MNIYIRYSIKECDYYKFTKLNQTKLTINHIKHKISSYFFYIFTTTTTTTTITTNTITTVCILVHISIQMHTHYPHSFLNVSIYQKHLSM